MQHHRVLTFAILALLLTSNSSSASAAKEPVGKPVTLVNVSVYSEMSFSGPSILFRLYDNGTLIYTDYDQEPWTRKTFLNKNQMIELIREFDELFNQANQQEQLDFSRFSDTSIYTLTFRDKSKLGCKQKTFRGELWSLHENDFHSNEPGSLAGLNSIRRDPFYPMSALSLKKLITKKFPDSTPLLSNALGYRAQWKADEPVDLQRQRLSEFIKTLGGELKFHFIFFPALTALSESEFSNLRLKIKQSYPTFVFEQVYFRSDFDAFKYGDQLVDFTGIGDTPCTAFQKSSTDKTGK